MRRTPLSESSANTRNNSSDKTKVIDHLHLPRICSSRQKQLGIKGSLLDWAKQPLKPVTSPSLHVHSNAKTLKSIPEDPVQHLLATKEALQKTTSKDAALQREIADTCELITAMLDKMNLEKEEHEESLLLLRAENIDLKQELLDKDAEIEELKDALRETLKENEMVR
jgi:hypothetical protein